MELRRLPAERRVVRRFVEELWLPYHRELSAAVGSYDLAADVDVVDEEVAYRLELLESDDHRAWVAVDDDGQEGRVDGESVEADEADPSGASQRIAKGDLVGFVTCDVDAASTVFDRPDRMHLGDIYVAEEHRGTGLARTLVERVAAAARAADCAHVTLDVDADNERALGFYEKVGFRPYRRTLMADAESLRGRR